MYNFCELFEKLKEEENFVLRGSKTNLTPDYEFRCAKVAAENFSCLRDSIESHKDYEEENHRLYGSLFRPRSFESLIIDALQVCEDQNSKDFAIWIPDFNWSCKMYFNKEIQEVEKKLDEILTHSVDYHANYLVQCTITNYYYLSVYLGKYKN